MKINLTLEVGDGIRRKIKTLLTNPRPRVDYTMDGRASRTACIQFIQAQLMQADAEWAKLFPRPHLTPLEEDEAARAVDYLRAMGKTDREIQEWLLLERARLRFPNRRLE